MELFFNQFLFSDYFRSIDPHFVITIIIIFIIIIKLWVFHTGISLCSFTGVWASSSLPSSLESISTSPPVPVTIFDDYLKHQLQLV